MKKLLTAAALGTALAVTAPLTAHAGSIYWFRAIDGSVFEPTTEWTEPLKAPCGFTQELVRDETILDVHEGRKDLSDMNTENETGRDAGRYLYTTTEVGSDGALTIVDQKTGEAKVLARGADYGFDFKRLDGIRWTPWGTLLFAEEVAGGRLFEMTFVDGDPTQVAGIALRDKVGILRHEGIEALPDGTVYVIDELRGGSIYKFVPTTHGDLSDGQLYALKLTGLADDAQKWDKATYTDKVGGYEWVALDMNKVVTDADEASNDVHATEFGRPEDVEFIRGTLYVANTSENRVVALNEWTHQLTSFVHAGDNAPVEDTKNKVTGFAKPDNLAQGPDGQLWIVEDNVPSDIWAAYPDTNGDGVSEGVSHFASLKDPGAEISGIYFGHDENTLFFNVQHPAKDLADGTWKVIKPAHIPPFWECKK